MRHWLANMVLKLFGWRAEGSLVEHPKCVVVVAPHTSNWDFLVMLLLLGAEGRKAEADLIAAIAEVDRSVLAC